MKKILTFFITMGFLSMTVFSNTFVVNATTIGNNMLTNPGFENGSTGWIGYSSLYASVSTYDYHAGSSSFVLAPDSWANVQQSVNLVQGQEYYYSAYIKAVGSDASGGKFMLYVNDAFVDMNTTLYSLPTAAGWQKVEGYYTWTGNNTAATFIIQPMTGGGWGAYIDDVVLAPMVETATVVTGIALDKNNLSIPVGTFDALTATISPADATNKTVIWTSSNESAATVSSGGFITSHAIGDSVITATSEDGSFTATCNITVTEKILGNNLVSNNGFEDGIVGWITNEVSTDSGVKTNLPYSGSKSYKLMPTQPWGSVGSDSLPLKRNTFYYFSLYVKAEGEYTSRGDILLAVGTNYYYIKPSFDVSNTEWTKVEGVYKYTGEDASGYLAIRPCSTYGLNTYIDDVVFAQILPSAFSPVTFTNYSETQPYTLTGLAEGTTDSIFLSKVNNTNGQTLKMYGKDLVALDPGATVGTGTVLEVDSNSTKVRYRLLIYGDVDGDGTIQSTDLVLIKQQLLKTNAALEGVYRNAADVNKDSNISVSDLLSMKKQLLGFSSIVQ